MLGKRLKLHILLFLVLVSSTGYTADTDPSHTREYQVKAAFIYNFAKFIEWPRDAFPHDSSSISLCILGGNPFGTAIYSIDGKIVEGKTINVNLYDSLEEIGTCHILFISSSMAEEIPAILERLGNRCILTVGDTDHFAESGGIINFIEQDNKIRFEINVNAAQRARLKISSKLANLAKIVRETPKESN